MEIDLTRIARIRARKRAEFEAATGQKLTYMPFIIASVVQGLKTFPVVNSSVAGRNIIYRKPINIGVAVALDWGLIVPVIKNAENLSLAGITRALNDLAGRARAKKLSPEEVQDGTFTITNPGVFGSLMGTPIISQPQVAILGVGAIEKRPKIMPGADGEDTIAIRTCAYFSLSFDHRVIDGAVADQFLAFVKKSIEEFPESGVSGAAAADNTEDDGSTFRAGALFPAAQSEQGALRLRQLPFLGFRRIGAAWCVRRIHRGR